MKSEQLYSEAMKAGYVSVKTTNALLFGMAGTGKTSTKHLIFGLPPPKDRNSTPLADSAERVLIREIRDMCGVKVQVAEGAWKLLTTDDLKTHVADIIQHSNSSDLPSELEQHFSESADESASCDAYVLNIAAEIQALLDIKLTEMREMFGSDWVYLIDSGGQPHFHNLLPLFIQDVSAALYVIRLSDRLDDYPFVEYYKDGKPVCDGFRSHLTAADNFKYLVQSMQSRNPDCKLVCIGTHFDKLSECSETIEEKNTFLFDLLPESITKKCHFNDFSGGPTQKLIKPINTQILGSDRQKLSAEIQGIIQSCPYRELKLPVWWYTLEVILEEICANEKIRILSFNRCKEVAKKLNVVEQSLIEALKFFHKHHIFHYYPDVLPNVVFCDTQILLNKTTELIEYAIYLRDAATSVSGDGSVLFVRDRGIFTLKFLSQERFQKHYKDGLFGPEELVLVFKHLLIAADFGSSQSNQEYFMPSLLGNLSKSELESARNQLLLEKKLTPLLIQFKNGWPRCGLFCCLQVHLIKECGWSLGRMCKQNIPKQNIVKMYLPDNPCLVTLIDSITFIEVYVESNVSKDVCAKIRSTVVSSIRNACKALHYDDEEPEIAFLCPHTLPEDEPQSQLPHPACILANSDWMRCTQCDDFTYPLQDEHNVWFSHCNHGQYVCVSVIAITILC